MSQRKTFLLLPLIVVMAFAGTSAAASRIVSIGGPVTEIVYALGGVGCGKGRKTTLSPGGRLSTPS